MPEPVPFGSADAEIIIFPVTPNINSKDKNKVMTYDNRLVKAKFFSSIFWHPTSM
ncbi:MAG: hypothetical protein JO327_05985 [Nitrososphaeraceae archaeon]|nr:hypothetical protein [Nitrososphaeraceae archaeon]MBV9667663.1 hypothetical protein [Nitrososphaeraceae archaeon]